MKDVRARVRVIGCILTFALFVCCCESQEPEGNTIDNVVVYRLK